MKIKTSELTGAALDYAVAVCEDTVSPVVINGKVFHDTGWDHVLYTPSSDWSQAGPILERDIFKLYKNVGGTFCAQIKVRVSYYSPTYDADIWMDHTLTKEGPNPLIAAMRCYVASKLGDEVEIPDGLVIWHE